MPEDAKIQNRVLYDYIQRAHEYVNQMGASQFEDANGEAELANLYNRRLEAVLGVTELHTSRSFDDLRDFAREKQPELVTGHLDQINWISEKQCLWDKHLDDYTANRDRLFDLGVEIFGAYLPIHFFFSSRQFDTSWGVYISEAGVLQLASVFAHEFKKRWWPEPTPIVNDAHPELNRHGDSFFIEFAYQVILRHELEHYKVESFALNAELTSQKSLYAKYLTDVYIQTYPFEFCLEEGLANATVLDSIAIQKLVNGYYPESDENDVVRKGWQDVVRKVFFDTQNACYKNYDMNDGWNQELYNSKRDNNLRRAAMNLLCNQVHSSEIEPNLPLIPFFAYPPDNYFLRAEHLVPIHIVPSLDDPDASTLTLNRPNKKTWERFLRILGYWEDRHNGGHGIWKSNLTENMPTLTISYKNQRVGPGAFRSTLKTLSISYLVFSEWRNLWKQFKPDKNIQFYRTLQELSSKAAVETPLRMV
jgi:hypothetical protein